LFVYTSEQPIQTEFPDSELILQKKAIEFGSFNSEFEVEENLNYTLPKRKVLLLSLSSILTYDRI
jgi:hypothetical protein